MIRVVCSCCAAFEVPDAYAGKRGKCKACGRPVLVPDLAPVEPDPVPDAFEPNISDDNLGPVLGDQSGEATATEPSTPQLPPRSAPSPTSAGPVVGELEPFCYQFLVVLGHMFGWLGPIAAVVQLVGAFPEGGKQEPSIPNFINGASPAFSTAVGSVLTSALIFAVVDIGRSLRAARPKAP